MDIMYNYYLEPLIYCRNPRQRSQTSPIPECEPIWLPYTDIPSCEDEYCCFDRNLWPWPKDEWKASIGCPSCGLVTVYTEESVLWEPIEYDAPGIIHSDTTCVSVQFKCSRSDCGVPVKFFTTIDERTTVAKQQLLEKLHRGFFSGLCPLGDRFYPLPQNLYLIDDQIGAIPSDPSLIYRKAPPAWHK